MVSWNEQDVLAAGPFTVVLGVAQDGGYPHAGCAEACCAPASREPARARRVACLGICDPTDGKAWLIDATPDLGAQLASLTQMTRATELAGVLLTHAHIGHYLGLAQLGREVMSTSNLPLYAMPQLGRFLASNAPWSQLLALRNVALQPLIDGQVTTLSPKVAVTPWVVPHRGEFSETVGFMVSGPGSSVLYLPDIDDWQAWDRPLSKVLQQVDVAYLDGTFFDDGELVSRDPSEVPHPRVRETMRLLQDLPAAERSKVRFTHLNHTNPLIRQDVAATGEVEERGFGLATEGEVVEL